MNLGDRKERKMTARFFGKILVRPKFGDLGQKWPKIVFLDFCEKLSRRFWLEMHGNEARYLTSSENRISEKNPVLEKKGKSDRGSWANRVQNQRLKAYLEFGSSDFDKTLRKCFFQS